MRTKMAPRGALSGCLLLCAAAFAAGGLAYPVSGAAADDDYLKLIEGEAAKVGGGFADGAATGEVAAGVAGAGFEAGLSQEQFAQVLRAQYYGSYVFFDKLPPQSREEIYQDYLRGASVEQVRAKITERFMNH